MTFRERLKAEHPEAVSEYYTGGCARCPQAWGYEVGQPCMNGKTKQITCRECWDREIKGGVKHES